MVVEENSSCKKYTTIILNVVGFVFSLIMLILAAIAYGNMAGFVNDFNSVTDSWQKAPIWDMQVQTSSCLSGYESLSYSWPGIAPACICPSNSNSTTSETSACSSRKLDDGCTNYPSQAPNPVSMDMFYGSKVCIQRRGISTLSRPTYSTASGCPSGYVACGGNGTSVLFCASGSTTAACPLTDVSFMTTYYPPSISRADETRNYTVALTRGTANTTVYLYLKRGGALNPSIFGSSVVSPSSFDKIQYPLVDVNFIPNDACTLSGCGYSRDYSTMEQNYKANNPGVGWRQNSYSCNGGCKSPDVSNSVSPSGRDIRYFRAFTRAEKDVMAMYTEIPSYFRITTTDTVYVLQARAEILWNATCPKTRQETVDQSNNVNTVRRSQLAALIITIFTFVLADCIFSIIECAAPEVYKNNKRKFLIVKLLLKTGTLITLIITVVIATKTLGFWDAVSGKGPDGNGIACTDTLTQETLSFLGTTFNSLSKKDIANAVMSGFRTGIAAVLVCLK